MTDTKKKKKADYILSDLTVKEVSLVDRAAIGRTFLLTKAADTLEGLPITEDAGTTPADNVGVERMNENLVKLLESLELSDEDRNALTGAMDTILNSEVPAETMKSFYGLGGYEVPKEEVEVIKEVEVEKIVEKIVEKPAEVDESTEVLKGLSDEQQVIFKEQEQRIERAEKAAEAATDLAKVEKAARILRDYVEKAANYPGLPFEPEALGPVLKAVDEKLDEGEAEVVLKIFTVAKETIALTKQDEEIGSGAADESGPEPKYMKRAKEMVEAGEASDVEHATAVLYKSEPELFLPKEK